ncbi:MAG: sodium-dependent transporter [Burkholderiaceae bacterium]
MGSIWKFPYELGSNGGGGFLLVYLLGLAIVVMPLMLAEFALGRRGGADPVTSIAAIAAASRRCVHWRVIGVLGILTGFLILSYYSVIGGWTLGYAIDTLTRGMPGADPAAVQARFDLFLSDPVQMAAFHAAFMAATALIVSRGIAGGIELAARILMPVLVVIMIGLAIYASIAGDLGATLRYLLRPDWSRLTGAAVLDALGLGFFSIGVGLGLMLTFAAYSAKDVDLREVAIASVVGDTLISLLAGLAVFPIVFANGLNPASGPGLVFVTLPIAFAGMPFGGVAAIAFYLLLFVAALASAISVLELCVAMLIRRLGWSRKRATMLAALSCYIAGLGSVLSFNRWSNWHPLEPLGIFRDATLYDILDWLTSNAMLPAGGLLIALFAGWVAAPGLLADELRLGARATSLLRWLLRWLVPAAILIIVIAGLG